MNYILKYHMISWGTKVPDVDHHDHASDLPVTEPPSVSAAQSSAAAASAPSGTLVPHDIIYVFKTWIIVP